MPLIYRGQLAEAELAAETFDAPPSDDARMLTGAMPGMAVPSGGAAA